MCISFHIIIEIAILSFIYSSNLASVSLNVSNIHFLVFLNFKFGFCHILVLMLFRHIFIFTDLIPQRYLILP